MLPALVHAGLATGAERASQPLCRLVHGYQPRLALDTLRDLNLLQPNQEFDMQGLVVGVGAKTHQGAQWESASLFPVLIHTHAHIHRYSLHLSTLSRLQRPAANCNMCRRQCTASHTVAWG